MARYYAISKHGTTRDILEITNKQTGNFTVTSEKIAFDDNTRGDHRYNRTMILRADTNGEKTIFNKIGDVETLDFKIIDCKKECVQKLLAKCIRFYEKKKEVFVDRFEFPLLLEFAYSPWKHKNRELTFEEKIIQPINVITQEEK